jgi:hypothetical protein
VRTAPHSAVDLVLSMSAGMLRVLVASCRNIGHLVADIAQPREYFLQNRIS